MDGIVSIKGILQTLYLLKIINNINLLSPLLIE